MRSFLKSVFYGFFWGIFLDLLGDFFLKILGNLLVYVRRSLQRALLSKLLQSFFDLISGGFDLNKQQALGLKYLRSCFNSISGGFIAIKSQKLWCAEKHLRIEYMLHTTT